MRMGLLKTTVRLLLVSGFLAVSTHHGIRGLQTAYDDADYRTILLGANVIPTAGKPQNKRDKSDGYKQTSIDAPSTAAADSPSTKTITIHDALNKMAEQRFSRAHFDIEEDLMAIKAASQYERQPVLFPFREDCSNKLLPIYDGYDRSSAANQINDKIQANTTTVNAKLVDFDSRMKPDLLQNLHCFFNNHRVAFVGDSVTRQHFDTLVKRLGWNMHFFHREYSKQHPRLQKLSNSYYDLPPFLDTAKGELGYIVAYPNHTNSQNYDYNSRHNTPRISTNTTTSTRLSAETTAQQRQEGQQKMQTVLQQSRGRIEMFVLRALESRNATKLIEFLLQEKDEDITQRTDIVIFSIGLHYNGRYSHLDYKDQMTTLLKACGKFNTNGTIRCMFRETLPMHWQPNRETIKRNNGTFPPNWHWDISQVNTKSCGPLMESAVPEVYNNIKWFRETCEKFGVPLIPTIDEFRYAYQWHPARGSASVDCTHYCQDGILWDLLHQRLLDTVVDWKHEVR